MTASERTNKLLSEQVGRSLAEVETPVAVVDLDRLERNLTACRLCDEHGIELWPHTKTHKTPEIGMRQVDARGGRPDRREDRRGRGLPRGRRAAAPDALPAVRAGEGRPAGAPRRRRLDLTVAVDSVARPSRSRPRSEARRHGPLLVELDVGLHRTGQGTAAGALAVAQGLAKLPASA